MNSNSEGIPSPEAHYHLQLPFGHLQLGNRAHNACSDLSLRSIQDVIDAARAGKLSPESVGAKTSQEIDETIRSITVLTDPLGHIDWPTFWTKRKVCVSRLFLTSRELEHLSEEVRALSLGSLHLRKACSGLEAVGIGTIGILVDAARNGIGKLKNFGATAHSETVQALRSLSVARQEDGSVDWLDYARSRGFDVIPIQSGADLGSAFLQNLLPEACKNVIESQFESRHWLVFSKRLLASKEEKETLESIASVYGVTRERVRQIEEECLDAMRAPLIRDDYRGLAFRFRPELTAMFQAALVHFQAMGLSAWTKTRWLRELAQLWQVSYELLEERYRLLAEVLGYRAIRLGDPALDALVVSESTSRKDVGRIAAKVAATHTALSGECIGMDAFGLAKQLKAQIDEIPALVELCSTAEVVGESSYRLRIEYLRGRGNQAVRVLSDHGAPMHHRDLVREIRRRLPPAKRIERKQNLVNQMSGDPRLQPIGKTGQWALKEWGKETRSLVDLIDEALTSAGEAMHVDDITDAVLELRPGAKASIGMLLRTNSERFRKVAPHIYALTAWGDSVRESGWLEKDEVAKFVASFFESRDGRPVDFRDLQEAFSKHTGLGARSVRGVLAFHPAVHVERLDHHKRIASYRADWSQRPARRRTRHAPLQFDRIVEAVKAKLMGTPTGEHPLIDIVKELESQLGIVRPNIYAAIDQSEDLEKIAVEGSAFKICRLVGRSYVNFPQLSEFRNADWRAECERAVAKLTLDDVDIGLFLVGRQFDKAMAVLLETARDYAKAPVTESSLAKLHNRIDWAVSRGVFGDKATLMLLKNERNERGHQPPTLDERRAVMKFAPFLAGLYIDYLIMIDDRVRMMKETGHL